MSDKVTSYLNLLYKLSDILNYDKIDEIDDSIKNYLIECKNICINKIKSDNLVQNFINEININSSQMSPEQFDNLGSGLLKLMRINENNTESKTQIKNELKLSDGNIKVQIVKK